MKTKLPASADFQSERLQLARDYRGVSIAQVARQLGVSRQYVAQIESGARRPGDELIAAFADLLTVDSRFFMTASLHDVTLEKCSWRKPATTSLSKRKQVAARAALLQDLAGRLESIGLRFPTVDLPVIPTASGTLDLLKIEEAAGACRLRWNLGEATPLGNLTNVVERAGVVIGEFADLDKSIDAVSCTGSRPVILRSIGKGSSSRSRFDTAHELGHLILHVSRTDRSSMVEREADRFASAFLMPASGFIREFPKIPRIDWSALLAMKGRWRVSLAAMIRRAYDLGILNAVRYRSANVYLRSLGWNRGEPGEPSAETPALLSRALERLEERGIGLNELGQRLGWGIDMLADLTSAASPTRELADPNIPRQLRPT